MLCWGNASYGQLGLGGIDEEIVVTPRKCEFLDGKKVCDVGCGHRHTVFLLDDGTVYTCGCNDLGQLGHEKARKKPGLAIFSFFCDYYTWYSFISLKRFLFFSSVRTCCGVGCTGHCSGVMREVPHTGPE